MFDFVFSITGPIIVGIIYAGCFGIAFGAYRLVSGERDNNSQFQNMPVILAGFVLAFLVNKTIGEDIRVTAKAYVLSELGSAQIVNEGIFKEAEITLNEEQMKRFKKGLFDAYRYGGDEAISEFTYEFGQELIETAFDSGKGNFSNLSTAVSLFNSYNNAIQYFVENAKMSQCERWLEGDTNGISNETDEDIVTSLTSSLVKFMESRSLNEYDFTANIDETVSKSIDTMEKSEHKDSKCLLFKELLSVIDEGNDIDRATFVNSVLFSE